MMRAAIVGCGSISKTHADAIQSNGGELIAVCDIIRERAVTLSENYGGKVYTDLDSMLEKEQIDVLHICLPHYLHVPVAIKALRNNVNVILEKPPAMTMAEFETLDEAVKNSEKSLCVCFQNRFNETTEKVMEIVHNGKYGKLMGARGIVTWKREGDYYSDSEWRGKKKYEGGGVLINQAIHTLDLLSYFLGTPKNVSSVCTNLTHPEIDVEDNVSAVIEYENARAVFYATTSYVSSPGAELTLSFERATVTVDSHAICINPKDGDYSRTDFKSKLAVGKACWGTSHARIIGAFYRAITGDGDIPCTLDSCRNPIEIMNKIYEG